MESRLRHSVMRSSINRSASLRSSAYPSAIKGIAGLDWALNLNGTTVDATAAYEGRRASASGFTATRGQDLAYVGSGADFDFDYPADTNGPLDREIQAHSGKRFECVDTSFGNVGTDDFIIEVTGHLPASLDSSIFSKVSIFGTDGWSLFDLTSSAASLFVTTEYPTYIGNINSNPLPVGSLSHVMFFYDASTATACVVSGGASKNTTFGVANQNFNNSIPLTIGPCPIVGGSFFDSTARFCHCALWHAPNWLASHNAAENIALAAARAAQIGL